MVVTGAVGPEVAAPKAEVEGIAALRRVPLAERSAAVVQAVATAKGRS